jgi:hypothetical protein
LRTHVLAGRLRSKKKISGRPPLWAIDFAVQLDTSWARDDRFIRTELLVQFLSTSFCQVLTTSPISQDDCRAVVRGLPSTLEQDNTGDRLTEATMLPLFVVVRNMNRTRPFFFSVTKISAVVVTQLDCKEPQDLLRITLNIYLGIDITSLPSS